jgi:stress response protein YsnF
MALYKIEDFTADSNYDRPESDDSEVEKIKHFGVYSDIDDDKVGTVKHILVDDSGRLRYLVVDTGFWFFGRQVLLPIGRSRIDYDKRRVYANKLTKEQVENLPDFKDLEEINYEYEERVRGVYCPSRGQASLESSTPLESPIAVDSPAVSHERTIVTPPVIFDRNTYNYEEEPNLYNVNDQDHQNLKLYEERLVATKSRVKTGEVTISKQSYTEMVTVSVPVQKERIVIEHTDEETGVKTVSLTESDLGEGEVKIKKIVEQDTVEAEDTIRREELDVNRNDQRVGERRN